VTNELSNCRGANLQPRVDNPGSIGALAMKIDDHLACFGMKRSTALSQLWSRFPAFSTVPDQVSRPGGRLNEAHRTSQDVGATTC
jgi:hypothetical protein